MRLSYRGFTIVELLGAIVIISIALLSILGLLRVAVSYTNKTRQETIAINLAREGMEGMYTRRNTNWLKRSGEKDKNRLCIDNACSHWFLRGKPYKLVYSTGSFGKEINFEVKIMQGASILGNGDLLLFGGDFIGGISPDSAGKFYRAIIPVGLYQKDVSEEGGTLIKCENGTVQHDPVNTIDGNSNNDCGDTHPKELRFCSIVEYEKQFQGKVELCGAITNYQE